MRAIILAADMGRSTENQDTSGEEGGGTSLRIDRWLWCVRHFKSRPLAVEAVSGGKVHVNGQRVKPAHGLKVGDQVSHHAPRLHL